MAFIDTDEFLVIRDGTPDMPTLLRDYEGWACAYRDTEMDQYVSCGLDNARYFDAAEGLPGLSGTGRGRQYGL
jgi:hypothetical protein